MMEMSLSLATLEVGARFIGLVDLAQGLTELTPAQEVLAQARQIG
jgi:hypothetical protein